MQEHIFQALHMSATVIESADTPPPQALGYTQDRRGVIRAPEYSMQWPFAAGALRTTVDDLQRWERAIATGLLLERTSWEKMATDYTLSGGARTGYGYGWFIRKLGASGALEHGGDIGGYSADMWRFPKEELLIVVLANSDAHRPGPDVLAEKLAKLMLQP